MNHVESGGSELSIKEHQHLLNLMDHIIKHQVQALEESDSIRPILIG